MLGWSALSLLLAACGGGSSSGGSPAAGPGSATLRGTAAVGAAIVSGTVTARCADGSGFTAAVTTGADGSWSGQIASGALPCALQVSGGTPAVTLHGYATSTGVANITPLTDLALALATTQTPATWFAGTPTTLSTATLDVAVANLQTALQNGGYTLPGGAFDPFGKAFVIGDLWDQVLDQLQAAIAASGGAIADYAALVELVKGGSLASLPDAPLTDLPDPTGNGAALAGADGITGTLNGTTFTYTTNVEATASASPANPVGNLTAGTDANNKWTLTGIPATVGTYDCKSIGDQPFIRLTAAGVFKGTHAEGGACRIQVTSVTADSIEGRFTARLINAGNVDGTVVDGYFRKSAPSSGGGGCSGTTLEAFNAVSGPYQLFAYHSGSTAPDAVFTARSTYGVMVDGDCSIAVSTNDGSSMYTLDGAIDPYIVNNSEGTNIILAYANGSKVFFAYDKATKFANVYTYLNDVPRWTLGGPDTYRCEAQANTIATPTAMGAGPYVIAYADAGGFGHIGIDQRTNVTATFSENQGLFGYRASANEDWNHGCAKNHNAVGDSVMRIGKWRDGSASLGYYASTVNYFSQTQGFHYAIAQAVTNGPASGSKSYVMPAGWMSEITSNALTLGGTITCGGAGGACVTVDFANRKADINITITPAAYPDTPITFIQTGMTIYMLDAEMQQGLILIQYVNGTSMRLLLAGPNSDYIVGSYLSGNSISGSFGLKVPRQD